MQHSNIRHVDDGVSNAMLFVSANHSEDLLRHRELQHHRGGKGQTPPDVNNVVGPSYSSTQRNMAQQKKDHEISVHPSLSYRAQVQAHGLGAFNHLLAFLLKKSCAC